MQSNMTTSTKSNKIIELDIDIDIDTDDQYNNSSTGVGVFVEQHTTTTMAQSKMEESVSEKMVHHKLHPNSKVAVGDKKIIKMLTAAIEAIPTSHQSLDSSKVWISFWVLNGLDMLDSLDTYPAISKRTADYFSILQNKDGGFGGGNSNTSHVVSTFASVSTLFAVGTEEAYNIINRETMYRFLMEMKTPEGAFRTEKEGEVDSRSTYCAIAVASFLNILTDQLVENVAEYLARCQTYEGGFGAYPGNEAHGGYTFCSVAALSILNKLDMIDMNSLHRWITLRQTEEGGFQGRANKLVDTCYAYWQGAVYIIIQAYLDIDQTLKNEDVGGNEQQSNSNHSIEKQLYDQKKLQEYVLICCQDNKHGGFSDHPGRGKDFYHTCYGLSGVSLSQHNDIYKTVNDINHHIQQESTPPCTKQSDAFQVDQVGPILEPVHPIYNIRLKKLIKGLKYFRSLEKINI
ncbi:hypothetical protein CYY_010319 [Polysphondylium violaceum]|uniref:Protein farnesyltransferase subunit beta n=1 Tax=Polysphondylium violaceum TaxID=133409 RepID=A0A8J4V1T7_9MYCE|nr:hypothetical protein CYY_010319 [Polysphondylium violaceum]